MQNSGSDKFKIGKQEVRLGLFAAMAIGLLIFGFNFLKGENVFNSNLTYYVRYPNALNLQSSSPVLFRGVKVGSVREVILQPEGVLIEFYAREDIQIPVFLSQGSLVRTCLIPVLSRSYFQRITT